MALIEVPAERKRPPAEERVVNRIAALRSIHAVYLDYQLQRINERDHHGAWDVAVNLSECECEISGLEFALKCIREDAQ